MHQEEVEIHRMDAMGHQKTKQSMKQIHETNSMELNKELQEIRQKLKNTERQHNLLMIEKEKEWNEKQTAIQRLRKESQLNMELESKATLKAIEAIKMKHVEELERNSQQYQIEFKKLENKITNEVREKVTKEVTKKVTQEVTTEVTTKLTTELTQKLTKQLTKKHKSLLENELNIKDARMNSEIEKIKFKHQTGKFFELLLHGCSLRYLFFFLSNPIFFSFFFFTLLSLKRKKKFTTSSHPTSN